jgi:hypothetical protein
MDWLIESVANAVVSPKMGIFEGWGAPSQVSLTVAQIRTAPRQTSKQKDLHFATVESNVSTLLTICPLCTLHS